MKIKTTTRSYEDVLRLPPPVHQKPIRPNLFFRTLMRAAGAGDLKAVNFTYTTRRMEAIGKEPALILMNHSSFLDLEIVSRIWYPRPYTIVCTSDGFVGKEWLMRRLGCIPTLKFVRDLSLIGDIRHCLKELKTSVLMYPEASYSFDGRATPLPRHLGVLLKRLDVPIVMISTQGAFARDPLYNCLQKRNVQVSATVECLLTREEIHSQTVEELDTVLDKAFSFDYFAWQRENHVEITEPFRADGLHRILYKCPVCGKEGQTIGQGTHLSCHACGSVWELDTLGNLEAQTAGTGFAHIPDWYAWERDEVRRELESGTYLLDTDVEIAVLRDYRSIYKIGAGHLHHDRDGFTLTGCNGSLTYKQSPQASYGLYADYYWYELGDIICIGNSEMLYYCFPPEGLPVAKARLAAEELYKMTHRKRVRGKRAASVD